MSSRSSWFGPGSRMFSVRPTALAAFLLFGAAMLVRLGTLDRQGLWADEIFSLAMATGHSLEHPAAAANPLLGDFVEHPQAMPASAYHHYLQHEIPAAGPRRVVRAVLLSDTSPPLYYLMLYAWTLLSGTGDAALRLFSILWALACLPLLWSLGRQMGGRSAALVACTLFAFAPVAIRYSTEGRMYSLVWFLVLLTGWLALRLHRRGTRPPVLLLWAAVSAAGLLTHYFYFFVWAAIWAWLLGFPGRSDRRLLGLAGAAVAVLVLPWYILVPTSLSGWRVTQDWLTIAPPAYSRVRAPFELAWSFFSASPWEYRVVLRKRYLALFLVLAALLLWRLEWRRRGDYSLLLLLWIGAACLGPVVFDLLRGTYASAVSRYALAGLPAAFVLLGVALSRTPRLVRGLVLISLLGVWLPGTKELYTRISRTGSPLREAAREVSARSDASDVILVHAIPSGVLGVARYLESPALVASWVGQLGQRRVPEDLEALTSGRRRIFLLKISAVGAPAPQEEYLREHATLVTEFKLLSSRTIEFIPRNSDVFFPRYPGADEGGN